MVPVVEGLIKQAGCGHCKVAAVREESGDKSPLCPPSRSSGSLDDGAPTNANSDKGPESG
jgi:hypothetical protein